MTDAERQEHIRRLQAFLIWCRETTGVCRICGADDQTLHDAAQPCGEMRQILDALQHERLARIYFRL